MSDAEEPTFDKSSWGPGPWQDEPDRWEGEHLGFPLLALRGRGGNWCGYAAVPPGHPWHGIKSLWAEGSPDIDVHGGITYSGACSGRICHVPKPGEPDNVFWLGFDCHHAGDIAPGDEAFFRSRGLPSLEGYGDRYRTLAYVQDECRRLAEQAKVAT